MSSETQLEKHRTKKKKKKAPHIKEHICKLVLKKIELPRQVASTRLPPSTETTGRKTPRRQIKNTNTKYVSVV